MTAIDGLAEFIDNADFSILPSQTVEHAKMHLLDNLGAILIGPQSKEGVVIGKLLDSLAAPGDIPFTGSARNTTLLPAIIAGVAATRSTEIDDIHLPSCTTPGSVIIPTALALANAGYFPDTREFLLAVILGYDMLIRLALAVDGPRILYRGMWPTYLAATLGTGTVAARALRLSPDQTASALATAITLSGGLSGGVGGSGPLSRWLTVGAAAQNGVLAALSAKEGFVGDSNIIERIPERVFGCRFQPDKLTSDLGRKFYIDETGMKPYPIARQALPAVEAFREIINVRQIKPDKIKEISVWVPRFFAAIIDRPELPANHLESVSSVQYQMSIATYHQQRLTDLQREEIIGGSRIQNFMKKIKVKPSRKFSRLYPETWAARVEVANGEHKYMKTVLYPKGDPSNRLNWDEIAAKFEKAAVAAVSKDTASNIISLVRELDNRPDLRNLMQLISR